MDYQMICFVSEDVLEASPETLVKLRNWKDWTRLLSPREFVRQICEKHVMMSAKGIITLVLYIFGHMIVLSDRYGQFRSFCFNGTADCCVTVRICTWDCSRWCGWHKAVWLQHLAQAEIKVWVHLVPQGSRWLWRRCTDWLVMFRKTTGN